MFNSMISVDVLTCEVGCDFGCPLPADGAAYVLGKLNGDSW